MEYNVKKFNLLIESFWILMIHIASVCIKLTMRFPNQLLPTLLLFYNSHTTIITPGIKKELVE